MEQPQQFTIKRKPVSIQSIASSQTYTHVPREDETDRLSESRQEWTQTTQGWKPFWIRRFILASLAVWYAIMLVALTFIGVLSRKHDGIASVSANLYYLWTYGPTAVLVLTLAIWNRVDYRIRQMAPWQALSGLTFMPASKTILLDYLSPTLPEIMWRSFRNKHWTVLTSSIVGLLQTALIVLSTGLFAISTVSRFSSDVTYTTSTKFVNNGSFVNELNSNSLPGNIYDAIKNLDLTYPAGTTEQYAYQLFSPAHSASSSQIIQQARVDVVTVDLDCEIGSMFLDRWDYSWRTSPCYVSSIDSDNPKPSLNGSGYILSSKCNISQYPVVPYGEDQSFSNFVFADVDICLDYNGPDSVSNNSNIRVVLGVGQAQQSGTVGPPPTEDGCNQTAPLATLEVVKSKVWVCTITPEIRQASVSFNSSTLQLGARPVIQLDTSVPPGSLDNISMWDFAWAYEYGDGFETNQTLPIDLDRTIAVDSDLVGKILLRDPAASAESLMDTDLFLNLSKAFYKEYGVQMLHWGLTSPDNSTVTGTMELNEDRLLIRENTLEAVQTILGLIFVLVCVIMIDLPWKAVVPQDLANLRGLSGLLISNAAFASLFQGQGTASISRLYDECSPWHFRASLRQSLAQPYFTSLLVEKNFDPERLLESSRANRGPERINWWRPLTAKKSARIPIFVLVIVLAIALEILLVLSNRHQGLVDVSIENDDHIGWSLIPAAIMAGVALYFRALQGIYRMFAPYSRLHRPTEAQASVDANYMSSTDVEVLALSVRDGQVGLCLMAMSTLISSFLTIIVSGVFTPTMVPAYAPSSVQRASWFMSNGSDDVGLVDNNAILSGLIIEGNLSYPRWTYENLVLPSLNLEGDARLELNQSMVQVTSPAIRPSLNCTMYDQDDIPNLWYFTGFGPSRQHYGVYANMPGPAECAGNTTSLISYYAPNQGRPPFVWSGFQNSNLSGLLTDQGNCPQLHYFWGYQAPIPSTADNASVTYAKALICYETIEQVEVNTTFYMPSFSINSEQPPIPAESTAKVFSAAEVGIPYDNMPKLSNESLAPNFFGSLSYRYGITEDDLRNPDRANDVAEAIKNTHRIVRAQQYNAVLRYNEPTGSQVADGSPPVYPATVIQPSRYRLIQNAISTHVLSALLLSMLVCALLASYFSSTKNVLPKNPCSVAAMASLLADSNVLPQNDLRRRHGRSVSSGPKGEWSSGWSTKAMFRMGWFRRDGDGEEVFTIDRVDDDDGNGKGERQDRRKDEYELRDVSRSLRPKGKPGGGEGFVRVSQTEM